MIRTFFLLSFLLCVPTHAQQSKTATGPKATPVQGAAIALVFAQECERRYEYTGLFDKAADLLKKTIKEQDIEELSEEVADKMIAAARSQPSPKDTSIGFNIFTEIFCEKFAQDTLNR